MGKDKEEVMSLYSKQQFFCNNCGKGSLVEWAKMLGRTFKVCSKNCLNEIDAKVCKSILGEEDKDVKGSSVSG